VDVELAVDIRPVNPFDFTLDPVADGCRSRTARSCRTWPRTLDTRAAPFAVGRLAAEFLESLPREGKTVDLIVELNRRVARHVRYVIAKRRASGRRRRRCAPAAVAAATPRCC